MNPSNYRPTNALRMLRAMAHAPGGFVRAAMPVLFTIFGLARLHRQSPRQARNHGVVSGGF